MVVSPEERYLTTRFGQDYLEYTQRTRRRALTADPPARHVR